MELERIIKNKYPFPNNDLTGLHFNNWEVLEYVGVVEYGIKNGKASSYHHYWKCRCNCGKEDYINQQTLLANTSTCCTDCRNVKTGMINSKINQYNLVGEYGIGYTFDNREFYFDLEDYDKIKDYCWYIDTSTGYVKSSITVSKNKTTQIYMHKFLTGNKLTDHINRDKVDNRRNNLRNATNNQNASNKPKRKNSKNNFIGVRLNKKTHAWIFILTSNGSTYRGTRKTEKEALIERLRLEKKYFGEFSPQRHLFEEYDV